MVWSPVILDRLCVPWDFAVFLEKIVVEVVVAVRWVVVDHISIRDPKTEVRIPNFGGVAEWVGRLWRGITSPPRRLWATLVVLVIGDSVVIWVVCPWWVRHH